MEAKMSSLKLLCAITITGLVPGRSFVQAAPHPYSGPQGGEAGDAANSGGNPQSSTGPSIGQVALQHPQLGLEGLPESGLGIVGNITSGTDDVNAVGKSSSMTDQLAEQLNLTSHWKAPFPPSGSSAQSFEFIADKWQLWHNRLYGGEEGNLHFVKDPFASSNSNNETSARDGESSSTVLKVDYQSGTYRQGGPNSSGGSTFFPFPMELQQEQGLQNISTNIGPRSILLKYDVSFDYNFDFVKGGKLPGIFYGSEERDCSGGNLSNDGECFSIRMMWRENGLGEGESSLPFAESFESRGKSNSYGAFGLSHFVSIRLPPY